MSTETAGDVSAAMIVPPGRAAHRDDVARHQSGQEGDTFASDPTPFVVERENESGTLLPRSAEPHEARALRPGLTGEDRPAEWPARSERHSGPAVPSRDRNEASVAEMEFTQLIGMPANATHPDPEKAGPPQPLIEMERIPPESSSLRAIPAAIRPQSAGVPRPAGPLPRAERADEPDEIRIHIGRIEVTAVPPPVAARPAIRPERRSVNLDEYLKQRRGGNR